MQEGGPQAHYNLRKWSVTSGCNLRPEYQVRKHLGLRVKRSQTEVLFTVTAH